MRRLIPLFLCLLLLPPVYGWSQNLDVPGLSAEQLASAQQIGIDGPTKAEVGSEVTLRLTGTPSLDLSRPLVEQLDWLMGSQRMYCFAVVPGVPLRPLDVRGELVFAPSGVTMQPLVRLRIDSAGEHRLIVDWNSGQPQLVEHIINAEKSGPDPDPEPDPDPPIPSRPTVVGLIEERDSPAISGREGALLAQHITTIQMYLKKLGIVVETLDDDQPAAQAYVKELDSSGVGSRPALVGRAESGKTVWSIPFGKTSQETIAALAKFGVK
jgi:hypothetical protein